MTNKALRLKGGFSPCTVLQVLDNDLTTFSHELKTTAAIAPQFFQDTPVILDAQWIKTKDLTVDWLALKTLMLAHGMVPVGIRGGSEVMHQASFAVGIPQISERALLASTDIAMPEASSAVPEKQMVAGSASLIINEPVRSGMQIYAKGGDLIVLGAVSHGAELMADGNIHIYGTLRGRALAGLQGNIEARIFCRTLEAELLAVAGYYLVSEEFPKRSLQATSVHIYLEQNQVCITELE